MNNHVHRRLLDLLAGWSAFADKTASQGSAADATTKRMSAREAKAVADLYQTAASRDPLTKRQVFILMKRATSIVLTGQPD